MSVAIKASVLGFSSWFALFLLQACPVYAADCPPGSVKVGSQRVGNEIKTYCKCRSGYVVRHRQCVLRMPVVDPSFFVDQRHVAFIREELNGLYARRDRLRNQLARLNALRNRQDAYLQEMGKMQEDVVYDGVGDLLAVAANPAFLENVPGLSGANREDLETSLKMMHAAVNAAASTATGNDRKRAREKALDAGATALGLIVAMQAPPESKELLSNLVEGSASAIKALENGRTVGKSQLTRIANALDGIAAFAGTKYKPLGVARSAVHAVGEGIVAWKIQSDKQSIIDALVSSQRAKLAAYQRLASTESMISFYKIELKKAGQ